MPPPPRSTGFWPDRLQNGRNERGSMSGKQGPWFVLPATLILAAFVVYPILETVLLSVTDPSCAYVGLNNYREVIEASTTARAASNTLYYVLVSIFFELLLGI